MSGDQNLTVNTSWNSNWSSRRVLVTGATGFVGPWLIKGLAERGATVWALGRRTSDEQKVRDRFHFKGLHFASGEITDLSGMREIVEKHGIEAVFHLAATNINTGRTISPYDVFESNIRGVYTILEACRTASHPTRAIIASSKEVDDCFVEDSPRRHHPYMASKASAELVARAFHDTFGVKLAIVRSDNIYGGGDLNFARLIPGTIRSVLQGERPVIRSSGLLKRDYVYVEDAVAAYLAVGERIEDSSVSGKLIRVATGKGTSVLDIVRTIARVAGRSDLEPQVLNQKSEERVDSIYTPNLEREILGWSPRFNVEQGLARAIQWYRSGPGEWGRG